MDPQEVIEAIERAPWADSGGVAFVRVDSGVAEAIAVVLNDREYQPDVTIVFVDPQVEFDLTALDEAGMAAAGWVRATAPLLPARPPSPS